MKNILFCISLFFLCGRCMAQTSDIYKLVDTLSVQDFKMKIPILDSLVPLQKLPIGKKDLEFLTKKEKKELRKSVRQADSGFKLNKDSLPGKILISSDPIYKALKNLNDTTNLAVFVKNKPFYMMSKPVFFSDHKKAVVHLIVIGRYSSIVFFIKVNDDWKKTKDIGLMFQ